MKPRRWVVLRSYFPLRAPSAEKPGDVLGHVTAQTHTVAKLKAVAEYGPRVVVELERIASEVNS